MSKGQMEILGLAIVVILIGLGILFALSLSGKEQRDLGTTFEQKNLAVNYINALLGTTTPCYSVTFRELIQDCAQGGTLFCEGLDSCQYASQEITLLTTKIFETRKQPYSLRLKGPGPVETIKSGLDSCPGELTPGIQYIPTRQGTITIRLDLCK